jgi:NAD(P)H-flavin reductase
VISNVQEMNSTMVGFGFASEDDEFLLDDLERGESKDISFTESTNSLNDKIDLKIPYITNVSEDPLLTGRLKYSLSTPISIGNKNADPKPTIQLAALGI